MDHDKIPELLSDLSSHASAVAVQMLDIPKDVAEHLGLEIARKMAENWGGQHIYIPKGVSMVASQRDVLIYAEFNGRNHADLARKYHLSIIWIYKIIRTIQTREIARRQGALFDDQVDDQISS